MSLPDITIDEFDYHLPDERIAKFPLARRNDSKLLEYREGVIKHYQFSDLGNQLPKGASLVLNNTKVLAARLKFTKATGARIEVFCLEPFDKEMNEAMAETHSGIWKCMVGNLKRFRPDDVLEYVTEKFTLRARIHQKVGKDILIGFDWDGGISFAEILEQAGQVPLPPYLNRDSTRDDRDRYQTVYAEHNGAVAAPTAGLHFAEGQLDKLNSQGHEHAYVTLHVSAGTFQPVKASKLAEHNMHSERIVVDHGFLQWLLKQEFIITVGTTSLRTLESLYWLAVKGMAGGELERSLQTEDAYQLRADVPVKKALAWLIEQMEKQDLTELVADTALFTMPGYSFKVVKGLITNFHQPRSTLLALIAAFIGDDWKKVYEEAFEKDYRFLSYGDSSLLLPRAE